MSNKLFPVFLQLKNLHVLLVGGGNIALEKLKAITANSPNTKIRLVSPQVKIETELYALQYQVDIIREEFNPYHLQGINLAIVATDKEEISRLVKTEANKKNILVNVADNPTLCDYYLSSIVQKGNVKIAISTNGKSPTFAKRLKEVLDVHLPNEIQTSVTSLNQLRNYLKGDFKSKVIELNNATNILIQEHKTKTPNKVKRGILGLFLN